MTSDAVYHPVNTGPFMGTINDAARLLRQLRQLPSGQVWVQDMGRNSRSGVYDPGFSTMRAYTPKLGDSAARLLESTRRMFDSLRIKPAPRRRDSLPL